MEETPIIIMQCPKCSKEFPFDSLYCEACTAMLEPREAKPKPVEQPTKKDASPANSIPATGDQGASDDAIEDTWLDTLKTDIEDSFISTLLVELLRIKERLARKEEVLSGLLKQQTDEMDSGLIQRVGRAETEVQELLKRTAKIESILENLSLKLKADIESLSALFSRQESPGLFGLLTSRGRYLRMLSAEMKTKKSLLTAIQERSHKGKRPVWKYALVTVVVALIIFGSMAYVWRGQSEIKTTPPPPPQAVRGPVPEKEAFQPKDLYALLDDIRKANLTKDLALWKSRYSKEYLSSKFDITVQWSRFDYESLTYRVNDVQMLPEKMTAVVVWDMDLRSRDNGRVSKTTQKLHSEFVVEDGKLKIAAVRKIGL